MSIEKPIIYIHTDGACSGNPGPGGWGVCILLPHGEEVNLKGGHPLATTNNRMELMASLNGILKMKELMTKYPSTTYEYIMKSDSSYVVKGLTQWAPGWAHKGFVGVKNSEEWMEIWEEWLQIRSHCTLQWERGHADSYGNNVADRLAREGCKGV